MKKLKPASNALHGGEKGGVPKTCAPLRRAIAVCNVEAAVVHPRTAAIQTSWRERKLAVGDRLAQVK